MRFTWSSHKTPGWHRKTSEHRMGGLPPYLGVFGGHRAGLTR